MLDLFHLLLVLLDVTIMYLMYFLFLFLGELLTVAPWAARVMPGLFALNERVVLSGCWRYGFFTFAAVGAYNVGSIKIPLDKVR